MGSDEAVDEAGARGVDVHGAAREAELVLHGGRVPGTWSSGVCGQDDEVDLVGRDAGHAHGLWRRLDGEPAGGAADVAFGDAGALADPSSEVSTISAMSALVRIFSGRAVPHPVMRRAAHWGVVLHRVSVSRSSQAMGWLAVTRLASTARKPWSSPANGLRTSTPLTWPSSRPASMMLRGLVVDRREDAGTGADDEAFGGEEGLALEDRTAAVGWPETASSRASRSAGLLTLRLRRPCRCASPCR